MTGSALGRLPSQAHCHPVLRLHFSFKESGPPARKSKANMVKRTWGRRERATGFLKLAKVWKIKWKLMDVIMRLCTYGCLSITESGVSRHGNCFAFQNNKASFETSFMSISKERWSLGVSVGSMKIDWYKASYPFLPSSLPSKIVHSSYVYHLMTF